MRKILVIEDESLIRENLLELLEIEGFEAIGADNGQAGVEIAKEFHPDVVLCDVMMPKLDGYGVLEALRQDPSTADTKFVFLTASADQINLMKIRGLGIDHILKPFNVDKFLTLLEHQKS